MKQNVLSRDSAQLKKTLDALYTARSQQHLQNDPLSFCHRYRKPEDQEVVGLIASAFAYGNVKIILRNLEQIFFSVGAAPRDFVERFEPAQGAKIFSGFKHRFNDSQDLCALLYAIRLMIESSGSIEYFFNKGFDPDKDDLSEAMSIFSKSILSFDYTPVFGTALPPQGSYFRFLFPSPDNRSTCKRLCMYLRWMVRPADGIDLGIWKHIPPSKLIIPVDAHIQRICKLLGLTGRKQADWRMAREITESLRKLSPHDPVKYDFSICHLGISEGCNGSFAATCAECAVKDICAGSR